MVISNKPNGITTREARRVACIQDNWLKSRGSSMQRGSKNMCRGTVPSFPVNALGLGVGQRAVGDMVSDELGWCSGGGSLDLVEHREGNLGAASRVDVSLLDLVH